MLRHLFHEIYSIFPSKKAHFGHDECFANRKAEVENSLAFVHSVAKELGKTPIIWNDPITFRPADIPTGVQVHDDFTVQVWQDSGLPLVLETNHSIIYSVSKYWYYGNGFHEVPWPKSDKIVGVEAAWWTAPLPEGYTIEQLGKEADWAIRIYGQRMWDHTMGCEDGWDRTMGSVKLGKEGLTLAECGAVCYENGDNYFGIEMGRECFCSKDLPDEKKKAGGPWECQSKCADGQMCGGGWRLSVYEINE